MLAVPQVDHQLLFGPGVKTKVSLVREIVRMKDHFHKRRLGHESLRLFALPTEHARLLPVRDIRFRVAIHYLRIKYFNINLGTGVIVAFEVLLCST